MRGADHAMKPTDYKEAFDVLASGQAIVIEHPRLGMAEVSMLRIGTRCSLTVDWLIEEGKEFHPPTEEQNNSAHRLVQEILKAGGLDVTEYVREDFHSHEDREKFLHRIHGGGKG